MQSIDLHRLEVEARVDLKMAAVLTGTAKQSSTNIAAYCNG